MGAALFTCGTSAKSSTQAFEGRMAASESHDHDPLITTDKFTAEQRTANDDLSHPSESENRLIIYNANLKLTVEKPTSTMRSENFRKPLEICEICLTSLNQLLKSCENHWFSNFKMERHKTL
jgi:hypothetical protein